MAGSEDTELRDLVVEALERNGSMAKVRALLRANIFLAFENEHEPQRHNPALDCLLSTPEGTIALTVVAEFLDFCNFDNTAYVYKSESRQGRAYLYEGRRHLPEHLAKEYSAKQEPVLVTILRQSLSNHRKKPNSLSPNKEGRKEDDNCTYIVHDESGSTRSQSDNSSDDKNKLLLRLPLDNSDTDTSSDSMRDKTSSEYIPNKNIHLDPDSEDESKHLHYVLSPKSYKEEPRSNVESQANKYEPYTNVQNATYTADDHVNIINSSDSTSYCDMKPKTLLLKISNGNIHANAHSPNASLPEISESIEGPSQQSVHKTSETEKITSADSHSSTGVMSNNMIISQAISSKSSDKESNPRVLDRTKTETKSFNYSDDFSAVQESSKTLNTQMSKNLSPHSTDESIKEDISMNGSDHQPSSVSSDKRTHSRSSISLSDVAELIENSARNSPPSSSRNRSPHRTVIVRNSNLDEVAQRLSNMFRKEDEKRMSSTKNSLDEMSDSPIHSLSNISIDVHSD